MLIRHFISRVANLTKVYKSELSMLSMASLMVIVWMSLSNSRNLIMQQAPLEILLVLLTAIIIHIIYLFFNYIVMRKIWFSVPLKQAISIIIMCSQKSSPVALSVIAIISKEPSQQGLLIIPCILGQLSQIMMGSCYSHKFAQWVIRTEEEEKQQQII
jgi:sodium/bile acid cotransporter 7